MLLLRVLRLEAERDGFACGCEVPRSPSITRRPPSAGRERGALLRLRLLLARPSEASAAVPPLATLSSNPTAASVTIRLLFP